MQQFIKQKLQAKVNICIDRQFQGSNRGESRTRLWVSRQAEEQSESRNRLGSIGSLQTIRESKGQRYGQARITRNAQTCIITKTYNKVISLP